MVSKMFESVITLEFSVLALVSAGLAWWYQRCDAMFRRVHGSFKFGRR